MTMDKKALDAYITREPEQNDRPLRLTEMLYVLNQTARYGGSIEAAKNIFKEWLKTVELPEYMDTDGSNTNATSRVRQLLITLVDEP